MNVDSPVSARLALRRGQADIKNNRHNRKLPVNTRIHPIQPTGAAAPTTTASVAR